METRFIARNEERAYLLKQHLELYVGEIDFENLIVIEVNPEYDSSGVETRPRLELARQLAKDTNNIILLSDMNTFDLNKSKLFNDLMQLPNVGFVSSLKLGELPQKYQELYKRNQLNPSITRHELFEFEQFGCEVLQLQNQLAYMYPNDSTYSSRKMEDWFKEAKSLGFSGTDQQIKEKVRKWNPECAGYFKDKVLDGIFVDSAEILFDDQGLFIAKNCDALVQMAQMENKDVFVLFDKCFSIENDLKNNGVSWKAFSSYRIRGATLECVISKKSKAEFFEDYQINAETIFSIDLR